jgi:T-complex protein 1 subunit beta
MGVDIITGETGDMVKNGITECFRVKQQILLSGTEAAEMIIRVDDIIKCAPRQREE